MTKITKYLAMSALVLTLICAAMSGTIANAASVIDRTPPSVKARTTSGQKFTKGNFSKSNVIVTAYDAHLASKTAKRNGKSISWPSNNIFKAEGSYSIRVTDKHGNYTTGSFKIDKTAPSIKLNGGAVSKGGFSKNSVKVNVSDSNFYSKAVTENGEKVAWPSSSTFSEDGIYAVAAYDKAGNETMVTFTVDKELANSWSNTGMTGLKSYEYGKSLLTTDAEKATYDLIDNAILNMKSDVLVEGNFKIANSGAISSIRAIYAYVISDHPEFFYISDNYKYLYQYKGSLLVCKFIPTYLYTSNQVATMRTTMCTAASKILAAANGKTTDLDKETAIHDAFVNSCHLDADAENATSFSDYLKAHPDISSAYGALVNNSAVSSGYSMAMKLLLDSAGIKTLYLIGTVGGYENAWNMVQISNNWYYLDSFLDDPYGYDENTDKFYTLNELTHDYFNYSSAVETSTKHIVDKFDPSGYYNAENYETLPTVS